MTWVRAADGALVNLEHVTTVRCIPFSSAAADVYRVTAGLVDGNFVTLFEGPRSQAERVFFGLDSQLHPKVLDTGDHVPRHKRGEAP